MTGSKIICDPCLERMRMLWDDWDHLCDVLRLDDETRVHGMLLAFTDALQDCRRAGHDPGQP